MRPPARSARLLSQMLAPGHQVPDEWAEWMTLVARCSRTSLAPEPLASDVLTAHSSTALVVATGSHDPFPPPHRLAPAARRYLNVDLQALEDSGHLLLEENPHQLVRLVAEAETTA